MSPRVRVEVPGLASRGQSFRLSMPSFRVRRTWASSLDRGKNPMLAASSFTFLLWVLRRCAGEKQWWIGVPRSMFWNIVSISKGDASPLPSFPTLLGTHRYQCTVPLIWSRCACDLPCVNECTHTYPSHRSQVFFSRNSNVEKVKRGGRARRRPKFEFNYRGGHLAARFAKVPEAYACLTTHSEHLPPPFFFFFL